MPAAVDEDVPRVRVGVVQAVAQHLVEERLQQAAREHVRPTRGAASTAAWSATVTPSISSITSTRRVDSDW